MRDSVMTVVGCLSLLEVLCGSALAAEPGRPLLDKPVQVGRLSVFENYAGDYVYPPVAFDQTFHCNEDNAVCSFKLFNRLNQDEIDGLSRLSGKGERTVIPYRADLYSNWVKVNYTKASGEIRRPEQNLFSMNNLALLENQYGQSLWKAEGVQGAKTTNSNYETAGIGAVDMEYEIEGSKREYSIRVPRGQVLQLLDDLVGKEVSFEDLKTLVSRHLNFQTSGYTSADAVVVLAYTLRGQVLSSAGSRKFRLDPDGVSTLKTELSRNKVWIIGEVLSPSRLRCRVKIEAKSGAEMEQKCEVENEAH